MYCPVCFQNTMKIKPNGVVKLAFNGKSKTSSLFTYNLQKETQDQLQAKLKEKVVEFFSFYAEFNNKSPIKTFEAFSSDFVCTGGCKIDMMHTKVSVISVMYTVAEVKALLNEEGKKREIPIEVSFF